MKIFLFAAVVFASSYTNAIEINHIITKQDIKTTLDSSNSTAIFKKDLIIDSNSNRDCTIMIESKDEFTIPSNTKFDNIKIVEQGCELWLEDGNKKYCDIHLASTNADLDLHVYCSYAGKILSTNLKKLDKFMRDTLKDFFEFN